MIRSCAHSSAKKASAGCAVVLLSVALGPFESRDVHMKYGGWGSESRSAIQPQTVGKLKKKRIFMKISMRC